MTEFFEAAETSESTFYKITSLWSYGLVTTKFAFDSPVVKDFIENDKTRFDLVISEQFQQEAFNMFAHKYNCPLVTLATLDYSHFMDRAKGLMTPYSFVPHALSYSTDRMTFFERVENLFVSLYDAIGRKFYYLPKQNQIAREAFESLENQQGGRLPSVEELERKISVHLVNSHPALSYPRPKMPGMIDIAGIHIGKTKPLPQDIQTFLDEATEGAIYVSFGSFLRSSDMPKAKYEAMLTVFRSIKQRVLWKWESDTVPNLPANVMVKKWLPQSDIFAHKNMKLFISHGGVFGAQEAIYHGIPMVLFPFFGDQHLNGYKIEQRGIGLVQSMREITSDGLLKAVNTIINNQTFYQNSKILSDIFRTNQNEPLASAVWWIEYAIKYRGAPHLQSPARNMSWFRLLQLDIVFVVLGAIYMIYDSLKQLFNKADAKPSSPKKKSEAKHDAKSETSKKDLKKDEPSKKKNKNKKEN